MIGTARRKGGPRGEREEKSRQGGLNQKEGEAAKNREAAGGVNNSLSILLRENAGEKKDLKSTEGNCRSAKGGSKRREKGHQKTWEKTGTTEKDL